MLTGKKVGIVTMVFMLVFAAILSGCTGNNENSGKSKDVEFLTVLVEAGGPGATVVKQTAEEYKEKTGIEIKVEEVPYIGVYDKLNAEKKAKAGSYDTAIIDILWFSTLADGLVPMDDLMTEEVQNDLFPGLIGGGTVDDKALGMPVWTNSKIMLYRTDLFEDPKEQAAFKAEYGYDLKPPTTWQEYRDAAKFFTRGSMFGTTVFGLNNGDSVASWLDHAAQAGAGPLVIGEDGKSNVNSKPYVDALDYLTKILREDKSAPEGALTIASSETSEMFWNGNLAMMLIWGHFFVQSNNPEVSQVAGKVGAAPMIGGEAGVGVVPGPWYQVIPNSSKKQDAAKDYVKFIYEKNELFMDALGVASRISVFNKYGESADYAHLKALDTTLSAKQTQNRPVLENWNEIEAEALVGAVQSALSGQATAQEALDKAAGIINGIEGK